MKSNIFILCICVFSTVSFSTLASQTLWEIDKNEDGIKIYTRVVEGSDFKSFKAIVQVEAPLDEVVKTLKNIGGYTKWFAYTKTSILLNQEDGVQYIYLETTLPWPFENRDMVYRMKVNKISADTTKITLKGLPDYVPQKTGIVRMKKANGFILLTSSENITEIVYEFHSEPGNNISPLMANISIADLPFKTLSGLRKIFEGAESRSRN